MPPPALGALPEAPPPNDTVGRTITKFFGLDAPDASEAGNVLHGLSGSSGKVRGIARVVRSLSEAGKLQKGDILVAETTVPPWTPLFATAAGIATDTGGILSHCAIVAREYRIPAVVGVRNATRRLEDGMLIEVDGDTGTVWIVE
jgi:pyruvate,water dikinase